MLFGGCGFQLQGTDIKELGSLSLSGPVAEQFRRALLHSFEDYGLKVVSAGPGIIDVKLIDSITSRRPISTSARINTAQYELRLELIIGLTLDNKPVNKDIPLSVGRIYSVDPGNLSGSYEEQQTLISDMEDEVGAMIVRLLETWMDNRRI